MHQIIALWSHPRSMSTATERVMRERGDLDCAHEPFMYDYYVHRKAGTMPLFDVQSDQPTAYADIRDMLLNRAASGPVFFKDMSYYILPYLADDVEFAARLTNVFLIRNPVASIASYYRLDPEVSLEEIGIEAQWQHFEFLEKHGLKSPIVLKSEDIQNNPERVMAAFWKAIDLPYRDAFNWSDDTPEDWEQVGGWHGDVSKSKGIRPMDADHADKAQVRFETMAEAAPVLHDLLAHHRPFYDLLAARALGHSDPA